jgi:hypothetical protein
VVREIARVKEVVYDNEPLAQLVGYDDFFGWIEPIDALPGENRSAYEKKIRQAFIPLLPPTRDSEHRDLIFSYFEVVRTICQRMNLCHGEEGRRGFIGMTELDLYEEVWPTLEEILAYENQLVHEMKALAMEHGPMLCRDEFRTTHRFMQWEVTNLYHVTVQAAVETHTGTLEEERAVMLLRLENYIKRCKESGEMRAELATYKLISDIQNLRKAQSADEESEMVDVVKATVKKIETEKQKELGNGSQSG